MLGREKPDKDEVERKKKKIYLMFTSEDTLRQVIKQSISEVFSGFQMCQTVSVL